MEGLKGIILDKANGRIRIRACSSALGPSLGTRVSPALSTTAKPSAVTVQGQCDLGASWEIWVQVLAGQRLLRIGTSFPYQDVSEPQLCSWGGSSAGQEGQAWGWHGVADVPLVHSVTLKSNAEPWPTGGYFDHTQTKSPLSHSPV